MNQAVALKENKEKISEESISDHVVNHLPEEEPIGNVLRGERMTMGLEITDVYDKLKIKPDVIDAIENNDLEAIGRSQFVPGYIRSYACLLKLDPEAVLDAYTDQCGLVRQQTQRTTSRNSNKSGSSAFSLSNHKRSFGDRLSEVTRTTSLAFPILAAVVLLGGGVYLTTKFIGGFQTLEVVPTETRPTALTGTQMPELVQNNVIESDPQIPAINYDEIYERQVLQTPVVTPRAGRIADIDVNSVGVYSEQSPSTPKTVVSSAEQFNTVEDEQVTIEEVATNEPQLASLPEQTVDATVDNGPVVTVGPTIPSIQLLPMGEAWVRLTNEDGDVLFEQQLSAGEVVEVPIDGYVPILRRAGNATQLYVRIDGQVYGPVGADGASVVNNIPLTPNAVSTSYEVVTAELTTELAEVEQAYLAELNQ